MAFKKPQTKEKRILTVDSVLRALFEDNDTESCSGRSSPSSEFDSRENSPSSADDSSPSPKRHKQVRTQSVSQRQSYPKQHVLIDSSEEILACDSEDDSTLIERQSTEYTSAPTPCTTPNEDADLVAITDWLQNGCECCRGKFSVEEVLEFRLSIQELTKEERDMYLFGKLHVCMVRGKKVQDRHARSSAKRERTTFKYAFDGDRSICKSAFLFIHDITEHTLKVLSRFIRDENGCPTVRTHKSKYKPSKKAHSFETVKTAVTFLHSVSSQHGLPQPAAPRGKGEDAPVYLPSSFTKVGIHKMYMEDCERWSSTFMRRSAFVTLWNRVLPNLKIMTPRTDVCRQCEILRHEVMNTTCEDEKLLATSRFQEHILDAANEREVYTTTAKDALAEVQQSRESTPRFGHYTFDFAQQLQLPHHFRQEGPEYFVVARRVQLFGVFSSGRSQQVNYLIDENDTIGPNGTKSHGPNSVVSMLDHYFAKYGNSEPILRLHADNCAGQNKNRTTMAYFAWRVLKKLNTEITLSFMVVGHTRCAVDGCFGLIKKCYRRHDSECLADISKVVCDSAFCNVPQLFASEDTWKWYEWDKYLARYFKPIQGIRQIRHFRFSSEFPGKVFVRKTSNTPEEQVSILTCDPSDIPDNHPPVISPAGVTTERQKYLYDKVRPFIRNEACKDLTCPPPCTTSIN